MQVHGEGIAADRRMKKVDDADNCESPDDAEGKADVTVEVEGPVAVVPPPGVKEPVQDPAAEQLDRRGHGHAPEKQGKDGHGRAGDGGKVHQVYPGEDGKHAEPVDRADGTVQKAPVYDFSGVQCVEGDFHAPAGE